MSGPLSAVLAAFTAGAGSLTEIQATTGLSRDVVAASVEHLVRLGRLEAKAIALGCPSSGCGSCASASTGGRPCHPGPNPGRRGRTFVTLSLPAHTLA
ncbi:MAG: hypothetical protein IPL36_03470 [Nigerium sp.]|nr:hypothetical protein [Nigerium sp.]